MARLPIRLLLAAALYAGSAATALAQSDELPTFAITAKAGRLSPERIEVPAGKKIKLTIRNEGPGPIEFENLDLRIEKVLAPGASSFLVIHPLQPGSYRFIDEFHAATGTLQLIAK
jgi:uncharacterized cupredoxin-like copper-binding protein